MRRKKSFIQRLKEHDKKIIEACRNAPRIVGFENSYDWGEINKITHGKNKGKYWLFLSVNVEDLTLESLGYKDKWSKKNKQVIEQFQILMTEKQIRSLNEKFS